MTIIVFYFLAAWTVDRMDKSPIRNKEIATLPVWMTRQKRLTHENDPGLYGSADKNIFTDV